MSIYANYWMSCISLVIMLNTVWPTKRLYVTSIIHWKNNLCLLTIYHYSLLHWLDSFFVLYFSSNLQLNNGNFVEIVKQNKNILKHHFKRICQHFYLKFQHVAFRSLTTNTCSCRNTTHWKKYFCKIDTILMHDINLIPNIPRYSNIKMPFFFAACVDIYHYHECIVLKWIP